jgi:hypothetical protein
MLTRLLWIFGLSLGSNGHTYTIIKPSGRFQTPSTDSRRSLLDFFPDTGPSPFPLAPPSKTTLFWLNTSTKALCVAPLVSSSPEITNAVGNTKFGFVSCSKVGRVNPNPVRKDKGDGSVCVRIRSVGSTGRLDLASLGHTINSDVEATDSCGYDSNSLEIGRSPKALGDDAEREK